MVYTHTIEAILQTDGTIYVASFECSRQPAYTIRTPDSGLCPDKPFSDPHYLFFFQDYPAASYRETFG